MCGELLILSVVQISFFLSATQEPVIKNYWEHIQELLNESESFREKEPVGTSSTRRIQNKRYPFELFRKLSTREIIRAGRESIESARKEGKMKNWSEEKIKQKCEENLAIVFEYLGFTIDKTSDVNLVLYCISAENEEPLMRYYLLRNSNPETPYRSLFGLHLRWLLDSVKSEWQNTLMTLVKRINEQPFIQIEAIDILYLFFLQQYKELLFRDAVYQAYAIEHNQPISILWLNDPSVPKPLDTTQAEINQLNRQLDEFISALEALLKDPRPIRQEVKLKAKTTLEKIIQTLPYEQKERLKEVVARSQ